MANFIADGYDQQEYADAALDLLLGSFKMANTVWRAFDPTPTANGGRVVVNRPSSFVAVAQPSVAEDLATKRLNIDLTHYWGVTYQISDFENSLSVDRLIELHIRPAVQAVARKVDTSLQDITKFCPHHVDLPTVATLGDIPALLASLAGRDVPETDLFGQMDPTQRQRWQSLSDFATESGAGARGVATQTGAELGPKSGFELFMSNNNRQHTSGTAINGGDSVGAVNGAHTAPDGEAVGTSVLAVDSFTLAETILTGDALVIAGFSQRYVAAADLTLVAGAGNLTISPALRDTLAGGEVITLDASGNADAYHSNPFYHRHAIGIVSAPIDTSGDGLGADMGLATDEDAALSLRTMRWYDADNEQLKQRVAFLWEPVMLDPDQMVIGRRDV